jgi:hypothetical protein
MFTEAMDNWDEEQADVAVAALARSLGSNELFEIFSRYGARDFRSIGHKAIYVANGFRALDTIGWQYSEPVLRSLAYALLNHEGQDNPAKNDYSNDRPWRENLERVKEIRADWREGKVDEQATRDLLATLYAGSADDLCKQVVEVLNKGVSPQSVWDALLLGGGECLMRQPGIVGLHTLTTTNAMHYAYQTAASDETRRMLMLQNAAFLPMFREAMEGRGKVADAKIMDLEPAGSPADRTMLEKIFEEISRDRMEAARQTLAYARQTQSADAFVHQARALVFQKGRDSHDYKFSSAVLEDYRWVSPNLRDRFLAASVFNLRGSGGADNPLVERAKQALA